MDYWPVFDEFRKTFFIGELVWNFADFLTAQGKVEFSEIFLLLILFVFFQLLVELMVIVKDSSHARDSPN